MHFLMPHLFRSQAEFKHWFSNPLTQHVEGGPVVDKSLVTRLHAVLRPFVLRRLKSEVATQMPKKFESVVMCRLSNRQRFLYEDFMSRSSTRQMLAGGNYMSMMNVLMQLRKVRMQSCCAQDERAPSLPPPTPTYTPLPTRFLTGVQSPGFVRAATDCVATSIAAAHAERSECYCRRALKLCSGCWRACCVISTSRPP